jgi:hypothetical protein
MSRTEMSSRAAFVAVLLLGSSTLATAQSVTPPSGTSPSGTPEEQAACRPDVGKHCRGIGGDQNTILQCLVSHAPKLTQKCRSVLESHGRLPQG